MYKKILIFIIFLSSILLIISFAQIIKGNITGFEPLVYGFGPLLYGAFNWADVWIFSLLWIILSSILLRLKERYFFWIAFYSFWLIRSSGEVMFSFMQQFHPQIKPWLAYAPRAFMQNTFLGQFILVRYWVVEQIFFQSISVLSLFGLIYTVLKVYSKKKY